MEKTLKEWVDAQKKVAVKNLDNRTFYGTINEFDMLGIELRVKETYIKAGNFTREHSPTIIVLIPWGTILTVQECLD